MKDVKVICKFCGELLRTYSSGDDEPDEIKTWCAECWSEYKEDLK